MVATLRPTTRPIVRIGMRARRSRSIRSTSSTSRLVRVLCGLELRSAKPSSPSVSKRFFHFLADQGWLSDGQVQRSIVRGREGQSTASCLPGADTSTGKGSEGCRIERRARHGALYRAHSERGQWLVQGSQSGFRGGVGGGAGQEDWHQSWHSEKAHRCFFQGV